MTPWPVARFMASMFSTVPDGHHTKLLDAGAGVGSLTAAFVDRWARDASASASLSLTAVEIDDTLHAHVEKTLELCTARLVDHSPVSRLIRADFVLSASDWLLPLSPAHERFTHAILNPPYSKINTGSRHRRLLSEVGIETVNLYTAFVALTIALLEPGGELVAIIPRSWCNGAYYRPFRLWMEKHAAITHIHLFESRKKAFKDDDVLQENVIVRWVRGAQQSSVAISYSSDSTFTDCHVAEHPIAAVIHPGDHEHYIHIPLASAPTKNSSVLTSTSLKEIGIDASTGPVVDFRLKSHLRQEPAADTVPLLYPQHFKTGALTYPVASKKPNAIVVNDETRKWLYPSGCFVVTKRFTSKEERRRVVAHVINPKALPGKHIGLENHLNVFHANHSGLDPDLAHGLALFLNSTYVDEHFRVFSGHTQVNVTDLRRMRYPSRDLLVAFGRWSRKQKSLDQATIDTFIERHL